VKFPSDYYDHYHYFTGYSKAHMIRELTLCECDAKYGWRVVIGECSASCAGHRKNWARCGIGTMLDLEPIRGIFEWYKKTASYSWTRASIESFHQQLDVEAP